MKKILTIDDIMVAFVAALGYGCGDALANLWGWPRPACVAASFILGIVLESVINRIAFSKAVQKKPLNRVLTYAACILIFVVVHSVTVACMGVSMVDYLLEQFAYVVGLPIVGFIVNLLIRAYRVRKIRRLYGDGSEGYVFDVDNEDIEEVNRQNQPVSGGHDADCTVKTRTGVFVGEKYEDTICYLGIPYAKPPVGELRWKAPEPLPSSDAVSEARYFGASAIQVEHKGSILRHHRQSEDCLTLNVYTGEQKTKSKKPVLVLFHHGDFTFGGAVDPLLHGGDFVSRYPDIVLVSFNYRLGIFGFIDFSEVPGGEAYPDAMNLGLLDQIAALGWIRENIAAFGGDPGKITVLGFDAGATSICLLAASEQAKGLFRKAFVFNGNVEMAFDTPEGARALAKNLLKETQTSSMEELLQLKTETLKDAAQRLWQHSCAPTCDGFLIPADVYRACQDGGASDIEFIIGFPENEMYVFRSFIGNQHYEELVSAAMADMQSTIQAMNGDNKGQGDAATEGAAEVTKVVSAMVPTDDSAENPTGVPKESLANISMDLEAKSQLIDQWNALCMYHLATKMAEGGNKVHLMYWDKEPLIEKLGSGSVDAAATLLGNSEALQMYGSIMNADLSEILQSLLQKFITGRSLQLYPNEIKGVDAIRWKAFPRVLIVTDEQVLCAEINNRCVE